MEQPNEKHEACQECGRWKESKKNHGKAFLPMCPTSAGNQFPIHIPGSTYDILDVGEAPGKTEQKFGINFKGRAGNLLNEKELEVGLWPANRIARTNSVRCFSELKPTAKELTLCRRFLMQDVEEADPDVIVALGSYALKTLTNLANIRQRAGIPIEKNGRIIIPNLHPAFVLRDQRNMRTFIEAMAQVLVVLGRVRGEDSKIEMLRKRYLYVDSLELLRTLIPFLKRCKFLTHDTEYSPNDILSPDLICLGTSFSWGARTGAFIPVDHPESPFLLDPSIKEALREVIETVPLGMHNAEVDFAVDWRCLGADPQKIRVVFDSMKGSMATNGKNATHGLKSRAYVDADTGGYDEELETWKKEHPVKEGYHEVPLRILASPYAAGDTDTTWQLIEKQIPKIEHTGQKFYYDKILVPSYRLNYIMHRNGIMLDWDEWNWRYKYWLEKKRLVYEKVFTDNDIRQYAEQHTAVTKKKFSLKSRKQMLELWELLKLPFSERLTDKGGPALDQYALAEIQPLLEGHEHRLLPDVLLEASEIDKTLGTYLNGFADDLRSDGRVHPSWHNFTESGRRGSSNPNTQNIPYKHPRIAAYDGAGGPKDPWNFRMLLRASPGRRFVVPDFGQIEFRLAACYCRDENMLRACRESDPHRLTKDWLGIERKPAKTTNFQLIYGCGPSRLQQEIAKATGQNWTLEYCTEVIESFKKLYPTLFPYIEQIHSFVQENKYVTTPFGHVRLFPHIDSNDKHIVERAKREAWNHQCQCLGHDLLSLAMDALQDIVFDTGRDWMMVNDTHDGFILEVPEREVEEAAATAKRVMEMQGSYLGDWLQVPLLAEVSVGTHFGNLKELQT